MMLHDITSEAGAHKRRKRVGRGESSGHGRQSGKGNKGCQSRAGGGTRPLHEGGQMPIFRRVPKRGFNNFNFRVEYQVVNVGALEEHFESGAQVDAAALKAKSLIRGGDQPLKVLGTGALTKKLTIVADAISGKAREAVEKAGGSVQLRVRKDPAALAKAKRNSVKRSRPKAGATPQSAG